jgi:hypothetical protein
LATLSANHYLLLLWHVDEHRACHAPHITTIV